MNSTDKFGLGLLAAIMVVVLMMATGCGKNPTKTEPTTTNVVVTTAVTTDASASVPAATNAPAAVSVVTNTPAAKIPAPVTTVTKVEVKAVEQVKAPVKPAEVKAPEQAVVETLAMSELQLAIQKGDSEKAVAMAAVIRDLRQR